MTHLAGNCSCGRKIHLSKNARIGSVWTCHKCTKKWKLSTQGRRLRSAKSKSPKLGVTAVKGSPAAAPSPAPAYAPAYDYGESEWLPAVIGFLLAAGVLYWIFGVIGLVIWGCSLGYLGYIYWIK